MKPTLYAAMLFAVSLSAGAAAKDGPLAGTSQAFEDAVRRGDSAAVGAMYADDGEILPPNAERVRGPEGIAKFYGGMIEAGLSLKLVVDSEVADGNLGYKSGSYLVFDKDGNQVDKGKWVEVWQKASGKWLMIRDIWNSDAPVPVSMTVPPELMPTDPAPTTPEPELK